MKLVPGRGPEPRRDASRTSSANSIVVRHCSARRTASASCRSSTTMFFLILAHEPHRRHPRSSTSPAPRSIGVPLMLAIVAYVTFIYAGIKKSPAQLLQELALPAGRSVAALHPADAARVPLDLHPPPDHADPPTPDEHDRRAHAARAVLRRDAVLLLHVLARAASSACSASEPSPSASPSPCFELFVAVLQAYVFTILTAIYIQLALAEEH